MSAATNDYLSAIANLPAGAVLRIDDVPWEDYEHLLEDLGEGYAVRVFYDGGRMEIAAPTFTCERPKSVLHTLITALSDALDKDIESLGSTTFKTETKAKGAEPDDCFYVQNASLIIGKDDLDVEQDPPPDLVVEIDRTNSSLNKFPIYAGLGVPELWRVVKGRVRIFVLEEDGYEQSATSRAFPFLSADVLTEFLARGLAEGKGKPPGPFAPGFENIVRATSKRETPCRAYSSARMPLNSSPLI